MTEENQKSKGMGGHHSAKSGKDEWLTPPWLLKPLGKFDLDPCAPVVRPWDTASKHYTAEDNGLLFDWEGRVWLNPPYGRMTEVWLSRLASHGNGIALVFARTETRMFHRYVWPMADGILFLRGRLHFHHVDGTKAKMNGGAPSVLIAYGGLNAADLCMASPTIGGKYLDLPGK
jgi:hypothetical protein